MKIAIQSIADKGNIEKERILLKVLTDDDIGNYALLQTGYLSDLNKVTIAAHRAYWFPDQEVKTGDSVVLYTKDGTEKQRMIEDDHNVIFYYWGLSEPIWTDPNRAAVLLCAPEWQFKIPDGF